MISLADCSVAAVLDKKPIGYLVERRTAKIRYERLMVFTILCLTLFIIQITHAGDLNEISEAAKNGDASSQYLLALIYTAGEYGVNQNLKEAYRWAFRAAANGNEDAVKLKEKLQDKLNRQDIFEVEIPELMKGAESGDAESQYKLGVMYAEGQGVAQNYQEAYRWISLAAAQGRQDAIDFKRVIDEKVVAEKRAEEERTKTATIDTATETTQEQVATHNSETSDNSGDIFFTIGVWVFLILIVSGAIVVIVFHNQCPACRKKWALWEIDSVLIGSEIAYRKVTHQDTHRDSNYQYIGTTERQVMEPYTINIYQITYQCKYCGQAVYKKKVDEN